MTTSSVGGLSALFACTTPVFEDGPDGEFSELTFGLKHSEEMEHNITQAETVIPTVFEDLASQCREERDHYERTGQVASKQKRNRWALYTDSQRFQQCISRSIAFVQDYPDCRARRLSQLQIRFLVLLQHFVSEDTFDFYRPEADRQHGDAFEGILTTSGVNSQLIKDAHRSEWSIEGDSFLMPPTQSHETVEDRKRLIAAFQRELVTAIESFLLGFCRRRHMSEASTMRFLQAVTTQMSQCGLANLDKSSTVGKIFVSGQGLEQRITYNLSAMDAGPLGEALKLSLLCMKTGFTQYHKVETLSNNLEDDAGPLSCSPSSYLYQYATLRFAPTLGDPNKGVDVAVIDALDEVHMTSA